jgi:indole-3-acetate monooxygenase
VSPGPRYKIPITLGFGAGDGMVALGLARNCINTVFEVAGAKAPRNLTGLLRDQSISQVAVGQAEAALRSGRAFLLEAAHDIWNEATSSDEPTTSLDARTNLRVAATHAIRLAAGIVDSLYTACGATVVFEGAADAEADPARRAGHLLHRLFHDMHVITQHSQGRLAHYELVGKHLLGLQIDESRL